jgi:hypothetical protein|tara:strand:- start:127 stop:333 length:207 start_codon:yes stop_codon:yes gene_type:complete
VSGLYKFQILSIVLLALFGIHIQSAYAYIDPGTGSMVIQVLIGTLVGLGIAIKVYWYKLKEKFMRKKE